MRVVEPAAKSPAPIDVPTTSPAQSAARARLPGRRVRMQDLVGGRAQGALSGAASAPVLEPTPLRPRSRFLARMEEHSAEARRGRLADRLMQLAKQRRLEDEQAKIKAEEARAPKLAVTEAMPLDQLGFMALMLRPVRAPTVPPPGVEPAPFEPTLRAPPQQAVSHSADILATLADGAGATVHTMDAVLQKVPTDPPDIAALMEMYRAQAKLNAAPVPSPAPAASAPAPSAEPQPAPPASVPPHPTADALSSLDPARRLAGIAFAGAMAEPPPAPFMPPPADADSAARIAATTPSPPLPPVRASSSQSSRPRAVATGWGSFAAGFAAAIVLGVGLYAYLAA